MRRPKTYTEGVGRFAALMREKMQANSRKSGWRELDMATCYERAMVEMAELSEAMRSGKAREIQGEAADVANFLMMLFNAAAEGE